MRHDVSIVPWDSRGADALTGLPDMRSAWCGAGVGEGHAGSVDLGGLSPPGRA
jgi:hypothetical protein